MKTPTRTKVEVETRTVDANTVLPAKLYGSGGLRHPAGTGRTGKAIAYPTNITGPICNQLYQLPGIHVPTHHSTEKRTRAGSRTAIAQARRLFTRTRRTHRTDRTKRQRQDHADRNAARQTLPGTRGGGILFPRRRARRHRKLHEKTAPTDASPNPGSVYVSDDIRYITFRDAYGTADSGYYYQQRWNASDRDSAPLASEMLGASGCKSDERDALLNLLGIGPLLDKRIILLSSGELRRFQIAKMLLAAPKVLIIESPFIGLDATTRKKLTELLADLARSGQVQIILSVSSPDDIPAFITHVYSLEKGVCGPKQTRDEFFAAEPFSTRRRKLAENYRNQPPRLPDGRTAPIPCEEMVRLRNITIRYGGQTILSRVNWTIRRGEKWTLTGANGSGKSTLLSLICADNPQAYSQDIALFGRRRGSGESIWHIETPHRLCLSRNAPRLPEKLAGDRYSRIRPVRFDRPLPNPE